MKYSSKHLITLSVIVCLFLLAPQLAAVDGQVQAVTGEAAKPPVIEKSDSEAGADDWDSDDWGDQEKTEVRTDVPAEQIYSLETCIKLVLNDSFFIKEANWNAMQAEARADEAWWAWWPEIKVQSAFTLAPDYDPPDAQNDPLGFVRYNNESDPTNTGISGIIWGADVSLTQPLFTFGKIKAYREMGPLSSAYGKEQRRATRAELIYNVEQLYYTTLLLDEMGRVLKEGQKYLNDANQQLDEMLSEGSDSATPEDRYKLELVQSDVDARAEELRENKRVAHETMLALLNLPRDTPFYLDRTKLPKTPEESDDYKDNLARMISERPEFKILELGSKLARKEENIEFGKFFPDFFLRLVYNYRVAPSIPDIQNPFFEDSYNQNSLAGYLGMQYKFDLPLQLARHKQSKYKRHAFEEKRKSMAEMMKIELLQASEKFTTYTRQVKIRKRSFKTGKKWVTAALMNYSLGIHDVDNLLDALTTYFETQLSYFSSVHKALIARSKLDKIAAEKISGLIAEEKAATPKD